MKYKNLLEMNNNLIKRNNNRGKKEKIIEEEIKELEKKKDKLRYIHIMDIFKPIAEEIKNKLKVEEFEWYGPFGMCSETTCYWKKKKDESITKKGNVKGSIVFISKGEGWAIRLLEKTKDYPKGSLAAINGMNYKTLEFNNKMNFEWLLKFSQQKRNE